MLSQKKKPLTHSAMQTYRRCARQYDYKYNRRLSRTSDSKALRMGAAIHKGIELKRLDDKNGVVRDRQEYIDAATDGIEDAFEAAVVATLLAGYFWRYQEENLIPLEVESVFEMPLVNPETGTASRTFTLMGKCDEYAEILDREYLVERKTTSEDISEGSQYWQRLRIDPQISLYYLAARQRGLNPASIVYDVIRKPTIQPRQIPELDADGLKIVTDAAGERVYKKDGTPRQSAGEGMTLLSRLETPEEYAERLWDDILERPDFYFARREIPRLESDLEEFQFEVWQTGQLIMASDRAGMFPRHVGRHCDWCEFADLCMQGIRPEPGTTPPAGYEFREALHPELKMEVESNG